jgi:hypothetical protein
VDKKPIPSAGARHLLAGDWNLVVMSTVTVAASSIGGEGCTLTFGSQHSLFQLFHSLRTFRHLRIVRHDDDRRAFVRVVAQRFEHDSTILRIQIACRLIGQE